jgi:hypothetical protein
MQEIQLGGSHILKAANAMAVMWPKFSVAQVLGRRSQLFRLGDYFGRRT